MYSGYRSSYPHWLRLGARLFTALFCWSQVLALPAQAMTHQPDNKRMGIRSLSSAEMRKIVGATNPTLAVGHSGTVVETSFDNMVGAPTAWSIVTSLGAGVDSAPGNGTTGANGWTVSWVSGTATVTAPTTAAVATGYKILWINHPTHTLYNSTFDVVAPSTLVTTGNAERYAAFSLGSRPTGGLSGAHSTQNPVNGNKITTIPIVGWAARGNLTVGLSLVHNSYSTKNDVLGNKWTHSYDVTGATYGNGDVTLHFGDDTSLIWTKSGGSYIAPLGHFDTLIKNVDNTYTFTWTNQTKWNFTTAIRLSTIVDENGNTITIGYDGSNRVHTITDPTSRVITLTYTGSVITGISDPLSRSWTLSYTSADLTGIALPVVHSNNYSITLAYTSHNITTYTTPRGYNSTYSYNADNSLAWEKDPYLNQISYAYNAPSGGVYTRTITDPNSNVTTITYDTNNRITQVKDPLLNHEDYTYDANYNRNQITDKRSKVWQSTYDASGSLLTSKDPNLNTWTNTYNSHNYLLTSKQPIGEETEYGYDGNDNLTSLTYLDKLGVTQASVSYTVNGNGQRTDYYDANSHHYQYGYNTNGYINSVTTPLSRNTTFVYDALGFRTSRSDAFASSRTTTYTPDNWERLVTITYPDSSTKTYTDDADNNLTQFVDVTGTTTRAYDNADRLTSESFGGSTVASYAYDAASKKGLLSTLTDAGSRVLTYSYTARNQLYTVAETAGTATYTYDANGNETNITNQNSAKVIDGYDNADNLTSVTNENSSNTVLSSFSYVLDNDNRRSTCTESNGDVVTYGYDWGGRLTSESRTGTNAYSTSYVLDDVGNRTSETVGPKTTTLTYDNDDQLNSTASSTGGFVNSYSYNNNGEQTNRTLSGTAYTLAYDYDGELTSITQGANVTSFTYDALGRRYNRASGGATTVFQYDGNRVLLEKQGGTTTATYTYGNTLVRKDTEYPMFDGQGSERTVANSSQTVTGTLTLEGFGQQIASTGSSSNPYKYAAGSGYRDDGDAGLMHVGARYYDAQVGQFTSRDTYLDQKPYLYCEHDPINHLDPTGHDIPDIVNIGNDIMAIGAVIGGAGTFLPGWGPIGTGITGVGGIIYLIGRLTDPYVNPYPQYRNINPRTGQVLNERLQGLEGYYDSH